MGLYTKSSVERAKDAVDMVELVGAKTELRRVGTRYTGLCPFHDERTPSFSVDAEHRLYHCFGCGASGDAISFVREMEGLDFPEAIEQLAERYNVELEREDEDPEAERRRERRKHLERLLERTADFYARFLWQSAEAAKAREHLLGRGLEEAVLREFRVGYAPSAWHRLLDAGQRDGYRPEEMVAAGVAQPGRNGGFYDRFRARIMFPLADARGRVLGFGARAVRPDQRPKYLNTSENELYHKGRQLFGIDRARAPAARAGRIVVAEGYTDVLALHQAGVPESVAIMGTALTQDQLAELGRAATTVYLALDADRSGQEAMLRASRMAAERGMELLVVALPEGADPADLVAREGADAFRRRLDGALSVPEFEVGRILEGADLATARGRDRALEQVRPLIAATPPRSATRDELVRRAADRLDLPVDYLTIQMAAPGPGAAGPAAMGAGRAAGPARTGGSGRAPGEGAGGDRAGAAEDPARAAAAGARATVMEDPGPEREHGGRPGAAPVPSGRAPETAVSRADRAFLAMCLSQPAIGQGLLERVGDGHLSSDALRAVRDHLRTHLDDPLAELPEEPEVAALVTEVAMHAQREPSSEPVLRLAFLQLELRRLERDLRRAAERQDFERQRALWSDRERVRGEVAALMGEAG